MDARPEPVSFARALRYWFRLGCISFGGPAGQVAIMHRDLVEQRRWIREHNRRGSKWLSQALQRRRGSDWLPQTVAPGG